MFRGKYTTEIALSVITVIIVPAILVFNDINIQIRLQELKIFLQKSTIEDNRLDHLGLVMKYRLHKEMYENSISPEESSLMELRVNAILAEREKIRGNGNIRYGTLSVAVLASINFFRFLLGMPAIETEAENRPGALVDITYYFERSRNYIRAIEIYDELLKKGIKDRPLHASIILHQGFCYSIIGKYLEAEKRYISVIENYGDIDIAVTAAVLLRYLRGFKSEIERVIRDEKDSIRKGEKLYKLIAYRESYEVLKKIESSVPETGRSRLRFFKARTLEELSETGMAIELYQKIITEDSESEYARNANRRIFIAGSVLPNGEKIKTLASRNNKILKDKTFSDMIAEQAKFTPGAGGNSRPEEKNFINKIRSYEPQDPAAEAVSEKFLDNMLKEAEERIRKQNEQKQEKTRRRVPREVRVKIYTSDGNIFTGIVVSEESESVRIRTSIGVIKIMKSRISRQINL